jgi:hypothetical protein
MATFFEFEVAAEAEAASGSNAVKLIDRLSGSSINLGDRVTTGTPTVVYTLTLTISPVSLQPSQVATVTVRSFQDGAALAGQFVSLTSSDTAVGTVPTTVTTSTGGAASFQIVAETIGTTTISASMVVDGDTYAAIPIVLTVSDQAGPEDYDATGHGRVTLVIESALANAMVPRIQRLSHQEQTRKYPGDTGLSRLTMYETKEIVFVPKALL